jgi:hypothetical protein
MARPKLEPGKGLSGGVMSFRLNDSQRELIDEELASDPSLDQATLGRIALDEYFARRRAHLSSGAA